jgi:chromosome segregation ATPase
MADDMADDNNNEEINVKKAIERSTRKVSLSDLEKKGFKTVKVLREDQINELIQKALDIVIARQNKAGQIRNHIAEAARREYLEETKKELKSLMSERAQLEYSIERQRRYVDEFRKHYEYMKTEKAMYERKIAELKEDVSSMASTLETERKVHKAEVSAKDVETGKLRGMLSKFIKEYPEKQETSEIADLRAQIRQISDRDSSLAGQIKDLVGEMTEKLQDELSGKLVAGAVFGGGGAAGPGGPIKAKDVILDALFRDTENLDSNIDKLDIKEKKVGGVSDTLAKLKNMRKKK